MLIFLAAVLSICPKTFPLKTKLLKGTKNKFALGDLTDFKPLKRSVSFLSRTMVSVLPEFLNRRERVLIWEASTLKLHL